MDPHVTAYIEKQKSPQKEICQKLRKLFFTHFPSLHEEMKVGVPYYDDRFYIVALKDHVNFGFSIDHFTKEEITSFQGSGKTVKVLEITTVKAIDESRIISILKKVLQ